jgi:excisionase family DNA binding protein
MTLRWKARRVDSPVNSQAITNPVGAAVSVSGWSALPPVVSDVVTSTKFSAASGHEYMNSREAAEYLHVKHRTLLEWTRIGVIPGIPLGRGAQRKTWLFSKCVLDEHLLMIMTTNCPRSNHETDCVN